MDRPPSGSIVTLAIGIGNHAAHEQATVVDPQVDDGGIHVQFENGDIMSVIAGEVTVISEPPAADAPADPAPA